MQIMGRENTPDAFDQCRNTGACSIQQFLAMILMAEEYSVFHIDSWNNPQFHCDIDKQYKDLVQEMQIL